MTPRGGDTQICHRASASSVTLARVADGLAVVTPPPIAVGFEAPV